MSSEIKSNWKVESLRGEINRKFIRNSYSHYVEVFEVTNSKFNNYDEVANRIFLTNNKKFIYPLIVLAILLCIILFEKWEKIISNQMNSVDFWFLTINLLLIVFMLYYTFLKKKTKFLETSQECLIINSKKKLNWNDILITGILNIHDGNGARQKIVLGTFEKITTINMSNTDLSTEDIIQIINLHKNVV